MLFHLLFLAIFSLGDEAKPADSSAPPPPAAHVEPLPIAPALSANRERAQSVPSLELPWLKRPSAVAAPAGDESLIVFDVGAIQVEGLDWRAAIHGKAKVVSHQGGATVWTIEPGDLHPLLKEIRKTPGVRTLQAPRVSAFAEANATVFHASQRHYVAHLERIADGPPRRAGSLAFKPEVGSIRDGFHAILSGRKLDQGVLVNAAVDETRLIALHTVSVRDGVTGEKTGNGPTTVHAQYQVPEVAASKVEGEWLIPKEGALLIALGAHSEPGEAGENAKVVERLLVIRAESPAPRGNASRPFAWSVQKRDPGFRPAGFEPTAPAPLGVSVPAAHVVAPIPAARAIGLPAPPLPERAIPQPILPDGSPADLPPLPDDQTHPASNEAPTAEPAPSPQAKTSKVDKTGWIDGEATREPWRLTLRDALAVAFQHDEGIRALKDPSNDRLTIAPIRKLEKSREDFQTAATEQARSVCQQYWALAQQYQTLVAREELVKEAEEAVAQARESTDPEVKSLVEKFRLDQVQATADLITTERQLRNILGLEPLSARRIVPIDPPVQTEVKLDWASSGTTMLNRHPEIRKAIGLLRDSERRVALAELFPPDYRNRFQVEPAETVEGADKECELLENRQAAYRQVAHQMTHALARFFLEVESNYKHLLLERTRTLAEQELLDAARRAYDQKKIGLVKLLKAMESRAVASSREASALCAYNISLASVREADGTLLERESIVVAEETSADPAISQAAFVSAATARGACRLPADDQCIRSAAFGAVESISPKVWNMQVPLGNRASMRVRVRVGRSALTLPVAEEPRANYAEPRPK